LDRLPDKAPAYLKEAEIQLGNDNFETAAEERTLQHVHEYLCTLNTYDKKNLKILKKKTPP
jgi:hypothetical protein